jgi:hypothetical protein
LEAEKTKIGAESNFRLCAYFFGDYLEVLVNGGPRWRSIGN